MVIFELLFNNWWTKVLMKPLENGLLKNCEEELSFLTDLEEAVKVLKLVFCERLPPDTKFSSKIIEEFIFTKRYLQSNLIGNLLTPI